MTPTALPFRNETWRANLRVPPPSKSPNVTCSRDVERSGPKVFRCSFRAGALFRSKCLSSAIMKRYVERNLLVSKSLRWSSSFFKASRSDLSEAVVSWYRCNSARKLCKRLCVCEFIGGSSGGSRAGGDECFSCCAKTPTVEGDGGASSARDNEFSCTPSRSEVCPNLGLSARSMSTHRVRGS